MKRLVQFALFCLPLSVAAQEITKIEIVSTWGGLGTPSRSQTTIVGKGNKYLRDGKRIETALIQEFTEAMKGSEKVRTVHSLGVSSGWLADNAEKALKEHLPKFMYADLAPPQREYFLAIFCDQVKVDQLLARQSTSGWFRFDDDPKISATVFSENGGRVSLVSWSNHDFIAEWIVSGEKSEELVSGRLSRALFRLLPDHFTNRGRLSDRAIRSDLADVILNGRRDEWDLIGAEYKVGAQIAPIKERFQLAGAAISSPLSIDLNGGTSWNAELTGGNLPPNLKIGVSLPVPKEKVIGVLGFLSRIQFYIDHALQPRWFREFLRSHPEAVAEIRYVRDRSLSTTAEENLRRDFLGLKKGELLEQIASRADECVFIELDSGSRQLSRWIVMPSGTMVLWEFQGKTVANWPAKEFPANDCYGWKCGGVIVSPDGEIVAR